MVLVQKWPFFKLFFLGNIGQEMVFCHILETKNAFLGYKKNKVKTSRKIDIFPKGLTHGFGPKMAIFPTFFFQAIQARKMSFTIFQNEKTPFQAIKTRRSKSRKMDIFPKWLTHRFRPKMAILPTFFLIQYRPGNVSFTIFQIKKTPFQAIKKRSSKSRKLDIFLKGLTNGFGPKIAIFPTFFSLGNIAQQNDFYDILERKNPFLGYKHKTFKKPKM